ncbi:MAG TPA: hypothetical protein VH277_01025 [Gemmatimonadaceae bacterium]|jgi:hypothetical protein|nr:hypothetical protein [Gemmatimonadaceae bacterium]
MTLVAISEPCAEELALIANAFAPQLLEGNLYGLPDVRAGADVKMKESYCWLTGSRECEAYVIEDALLDAQLAGHAAREVVRSYIAVLLHDKQRAPWGTFCHFDFAPRQARQATLEQLEAFRPLIEEMFVRDNPARRDPDAPSLRRTARPE